MEMKYNDFKIEWEFPWQARPEVKKGFAGELLVKDFFEKKDYVVYLPVTENKAHGFDMLLYKNGEYPFAVEVKTKASSATFNETGIEKRLFDRYSELCKKTNLKLLLVFVDERTASFYGAFFDELCKEVVIGNITYPKLTYRKDGTCPTFFFHLNTMRELGTLSVLETRYLKTLGEYIKK